MYLFVQRFLIDIKYINNIHKRLDRLLQAYKNKGVLAQKELLPALSEQGLKERCSWFPSDLPKEIIALYTWRGGQECNEWVEHPFFFRDTIFCDLKTSKDDYAQIVVPYAADGEEDSELGWEYLRYSFPFTSFEGAVYVIPSQPFVIDERFERPVILVHEGVNPVYESLETMLDTCIEWVENATYNMEYEFLEINNEHEIWKKHNPKIFN